MPPKRKRKTDAEADADAEAAAAAEKKKESKAEKKKRIEESKLKAKRWAEKRKQKTALAASGGGGGSGSGSGSGTVKKPSTSGSSSATKASKPKPTAKSAATPSKKKSSSTASASSAASKPPRSSTRTRTRKKADMPSSSSSEDEKEDEEEKEVRQPKAKRRRTTRDSTTTTTRTSRTTKSDDTIDMKMADVVNAASANSNEAMNANAAVAVAAPTQTASSPLRVPQKSNYEVPTPQPPPQPQLQQQPQQPIFPNVASVPAPAPTTAAMNTPLGNNSNMGAATATTTNQILLSPTDPNVVYVPVQVNASQQQSAPAPVPPQPVAQMPTMPMPMQVPTPTQIPIQQQSTTSFVRPPVAPVQMPTPTQIPIQQQSTSFVRPPVAAPSPVPPPMSVTTKQETKTTSPVPSMVPPLDFKVEVEKEEEEEEEELDRMIKQEEEEKREHKQSKLKKLWIMARSFSLCIMIGVVAYIALNEILSSSSSSSSLSNDEIGAGNSTDRISHQKGKNAASKASITTPCFNNRGFGGENEEMDIVGGSCLDTEEDGTTTIQSCPDHGRCEGGKLIDCNYHENDAIALATKEDLLGPPFYVPSSDGMSCSISPSAMDAMLHLHSTLVDVTVEYVCRSNVGLGPKCQLGRQDIFVGKVDAVEDADDHESTSGIANDDDDGRNGSSILFSLDAVANLTNLTPNVIGMLVGKIEESDVMIVEKSSSESDTDTDLDTADASSSYLIGLSEQYIKKELPTPLSCWIRILCWDLCRALCILVYSILGLLCKLIWSIVSANPVPTFVVGVCTWTVLWIKNKRLKVKGLRKEVAEIQNIACDKLILDCNEGEGYAALHLRDEIAHELYPEQCAERKRLLAEVWPRVVASIRADNRVMKTRKTIRGKSMEWFEWVAESSRNSRRSGVNAIYTKSTAEENVTTRPKME